MKKLFLFVFLSVFSHAFAQTGHFISPDRFSSSLVSSICQDNLGSIWVGTDYGLNRFDGYNFGVYLHDDADSTSLSVNTITVLFSDSSGRLWVGTNRGLDRFDEATSSFKHYRFPEGLAPRVSSIIQRHDGTILVGTAGYGAFSIGKDDKLTACFTNAEQPYFVRLFEDSHGRLWKGGFNDVISYFEGEKEHKFNSTCGNVEAFIEQAGEILVLCQNGIMSYRGNQIAKANIDLSAIADKDVVFSRIAVNDEGTIYIGTRGWGVYTISADRRLVHAEINTSGVDPNTSSVNSIYFDRNGNLWLGLHRKGLVIVPLHPVPFSDWSFSSQGYLLGSTISSVCDGDDGMTWCTIRDIGVYGFNESGRIVAHPASPEGVEFIFRDRQHRFWLGSNDAIYAYDPKTGRSQHKFSFECDHFKDMTSDDQGRIYISTFARGFCIFDPSTGSVRNHHFLERDSVRGYLCNNWVMGMSADRQGLIWMATASGVSCYDPRVDGFRTQGWNSILDRIICFDLCELHRGRLADGRSLDGCIAIATEEGLYLYDRQKHSVERFPGSEQLNNKIVSYVVQSNDGDIWCSTSQGIWQYDLDRQVFVGHVKGNGLSQMEFLYGIGMHTDDDRIFFGHSDGLTVFSPANVSEYHPMLDSLQLSAFFVGNQKIDTRTVLNDVQITKRPVHESDHFTLSYLDHTVTMAFSQFNFENPRNVRFEMRVDDGEWLHNVEGKNDFTLSHLHPGTYRISVRAQVGSGYTPEKVIYITIRGPWYKSTVAYVIYALIVVLLIVYINFNYRRRTTEQMNEEKMKFLINATHDIRSPLTLILAALKKLKSAPDDNALDTIERNSQRILNLVNQILDVRKIDKQQMHLHCKQTEFITFARGIYKMFEFSAKERNITFQFTTDDEQFDVWIDRSQFDKVVTNLLSNAFKYTCEGGTIELRISHDENQMQLQVIDSGVGLDPDSLKHIFDRFYQGNNSRRMHIDGTGIGLNLCKMIVDMHHGEIHASNRTDGQNGSVFTITLPLGNAHLSEEDIDREEVEEIVADTTETKEEEKPSKATTKSSKRGSSSKRRVLIVDDDLEIGHYISTELGHYYKFGLCSNGREGLKELLTNDYDIVVSDVMMPEMDGFSMLRLIKTNLNISHLPVIMLTSKADVGNRLEGLERGADAFLAKPFDMEELHMVIENLIQGRQRLKGKYSGAQQQADKVEQPEVKGNDEQLMERIMKVINKNLSDSDFNVEILTSEVGISRAQLHRKMKEMTGLSTSEFIRNIRLEQAARLLKEQKINVTQVAYTVGFSNLAHFSTIFRKHFGVSPSEYVG